LTPTGIELATFRFVAQHRKRCGTVKVVLRYRTSGNSEPVTPHSIPEELSSHQHCYGAALRPIIDCNIKLCIFVFTPCILISIHYLHQLMHIFNTQLFCNCWNKAPKHVGAFIYNFVLYIYIYTHTHTHICMGRVAQSVWRLTTSWTVRDRIPVWTSFSARPDRPWGTPSLL